MNRIGHLFTFSIVLFVCMACSKDFQTNSHLLTAMQTVDDNPKEALQLLEEIPFPNTMDQESYMRYIVTLAQARYMNYEDITGDTLVLEAQRYFTKKESPEMAARACYYTAAYWNEKADEDKSLEYALLAHYYAQRAGNKLFQAKSAQWIGSLYYDQEILGKALEYYQQAEELYNIVANSELNLLDIKCIRGRICCELEQYDEALSYFDKGLEDAQRIDNQLYEAKFAHYRGVVFREKRMYSESKKNFDLALLKKSTPEDSLRVYLSYARLYRLCNQLDSSKYYLEYVKNRIAGIIYPYARLFAYNELALFYEKEGNIPELKRYMKLLNEEEIKIRTLKTEEKIQSINQQFESYKRKADRKYDRMWKIGFPIVVALFFLVLVFRQNWYKMRLMVRTLREIHLFHKKSQEFFLLDNLISINLSMYQLAQDQGVAVAFNTPIYKRFQELRDKVNLEIAGLIQGILAKSSKGDKVLSKFTTEELCVIFLCRWKKYTDNDIKRLLGYGDDMVWIDVATIKRRIRRILAEAGMKEREINGVLLSNC